VSKHSEELKAEVERIAGLRAQIPRYKQVAAKHGVSMQVVRRLVFEAIQRMKIRVHVEHSGEE